MIILMKKVFYFVEFPSIQEVQRILTTRLP